MLRLFGMAFIYITLAIFGMELIAALAAGHYSVRSIGQQWFAFGPDSLTGFSNFLTGMAPWLWDPVFLTLLAIPAWLPTLLLGILFLLLARRPARKKKMFA